MACARSNWSSVRRASSRKIAPAALEQPDLQGAFDFLNLHGQGRRRDAKRLGRAAKVQVFGEHDEIAKVAQLHGSLVYT